MHLRLKGGADMLRKKVKGQIAETTFKLWQKSIMIKRNLSSKIE